MKKKTQTYNDGVLDIYLVGNISQEGNMPVDKLTLKIGKLRYENRRVGMSRFWIAKQATARIDKMVRVPRLRISSQDVALIDGEQYRIIQTQDQDDVSPISMDLSLERLEVKFEVDEPEVEEDETD
jgi:hypothetical protein